MTTRLHTNFTLTSVVSRGELKKKICKLVDTFVVLLEEVTRHNYTRRESEQLKQESSRLRGKPVRRLRTDG